MAVLHTIRADGVDCILAIRHSCSLLNQLLGLCSSCSTMTLKVLELMVTEDHSDELCRSNVTPDAAE